VSGKLSTHVLDTALGRPAAGVAIELWYLGEGPGDPAAPGPDGLAPGATAPRAVAPGAGGPLPKTVAAAVTNKDGRTDAPLLSGETMRAGRYRLTFAIGSYYRAQGHPDAGRFLEDVPVEFILADTSASYHVPLLTTPWSYSTYRGS
jgi:5-hydroxyisourate hydrolase